MYKSRREAFFTASPSFVAFRKTYEVEMTHGSNPSNEQKGSKRKFSESDSCTSSEETVFSGIPVASVKGEKLAIATIPPYKVKDSEATTSKSGSSCSSSSVDVHEYSFSDVKPLERDNTRKTYNQVIKRKRTETEVVYCAEDENAAQCKRRPKFDIDDWPAVDPYESCEVCGKKFSGPKNYQEHLASKGHKRKMAERTILNQVTRNGVVDVDLLKEMIKEKYEKKTGEASERGEMSDELKQQISGSALDVLLEDSNKFPYECKPCGKVFSDLITFIVHLKSKRHSKMEETMKFHETIRVHPGKGSGSRPCGIENLMSRVEITTCAMCNATLSGYENAVLRENGDGYPRKLSSQEHITEYKHIPKTPPLKKF